MFIETALGNIFSLFPSPCALEEGRGEGSSIKNRKSKIKNQKIPLPDCGVREIMIDWLHLSWEECLRRAWQKQTSEGRHIRALLKLGAVLKHGDIVWRNAETLVAIDVIPCEVLVAESKNEIETASLAYKLGDLHVPVEMNGAELITVSDGPIQAIFHELDIPCHGELRRFQPNLRSATAQITLANDFELLHTR